VPKVLKYRVLEPELPPEQHLSPLRLSRVGEDPTLVVLGLDDEHTEPGNENVVNLSRPVLQLKGDVIHQVIFRRTEVPPRNARQQRLATVLVFAGGAGGTVTAKEEANEQREKDGDNEFVVQRPVQDELRLTPNRRVIWQS